MIVLPGSRANGPPKIVAAGTIVAVMPEHTPTVLPTEPVEGVKGGKGGDFQITNAEFVAAVFTDVPETIRNALCRDAQGRASGPLGAALDLLAEMSS
jgi:hypothetical protein